MRTLTDTLLRLEGPRNFCYSVFQWKWEEGPLSFPKLSAFRPLDYLDRVVEGVAGPHEGRPEVAAPERGVHHIVLRAWADVVHCAQDCLVKGECSLLEQKTKKLSQNRPKNRNNLKTKNSSSLKI